MPQGVGREKFRTRVQRFLLSKLHHIAQLRREHAALHINGVKPRAQSVKAPGAVPRANVDPRLLMISSSTLKDKVQQALRTADTQGNENLEAAPALDTTTTTTATAASAERATPPHSPLKMYYEAFRHAFKKVTHYSRSIPFDVRWDRIQSNLSLLGRMSTGNVVTPFTDSADAFEQMWAAVDRGKKEVLWQTYICKDDHVGQTTVKKLTAACRRNCTTELLYDSGGNISGRSRLTEELKACGATVITYRPFFTYSLQYIFRGLDWKKSPGLRNHRKILLVDGAIGFCGGLNIGDDYCGRRMGGNGRFLDAHCSVTGPAVQHLREVYDDTKQPRPWKYGWTRWRQIASRALHRGYDAGKLAIERSFTHPLSASLRAAAPRGGVSFRRRSAGREAETSKQTKKTRWSRQAERLRRAVRCPSPSASSTNAGSGGAASSACGEPIKREPGKPLQESSALAKPTSHADTVQDIDNNGRSNDRATSAYLPPTTASTAGEGGEKYVYESATKRKVMEARARAMGTASDVSQKRMYTSVLLRLPLADTDPVPEAEAYGLLRPPTTLIVSCNPRCRDYSIQYTFWQVTRKCHRRLWISTPYYLPTRKLFRALIHSASRGVDVRILAGSSRTTDPWFMWYASNYVTGRLLRAGVRIYEYKGTQIMHAKTVVCDSIWSSIGSYNWDTMSNRNLEVCLCHTCFDTARSMEGRFLEGVALSTEVKLSDHRQRSWWLRFTSWFFYKVVYFLDNIAFRSFSNENVDPSSYVPRT